MLVTINTDASCNHELKIGTFSFWMVCDQGRLFGAGQLKGEILQPNEAEFKAILNALHFLKDRSGWKGVSKVVLNTDSQCCIEIIQGTANHQWAVLLKAEFQRTVKKLGAAVEARKVKAHSGVDEKRKYVNAWCDRQAKHLLRTIIKTQQ